MPGIDYSRLKWITVLAPVAFIALFEQVRRRLDPPFATGVFADALWLLALAGAAVGFSVFVFRTLERMRAREVADEAQMRAVFLNGSDAMVILDAAGRIERMNPAAESLTGMAAGQVAGSHAFCDLFGCRAGENAPPHECFVVRAARENSPIRYLETAVRGRRGPVPVSLSASPLGLGGENKVVVVIRDLSEQRRLEREVSQLYDETLRRQREVEALYRIGTDLAAFYEGESAMARVLPRIAELSGADVVALAAGGSGGEELRLVGVVGNRREAALGVSLAPGEGLVGCAVVSGRPVATQDFPHDAGEPAAASCPLMAAEGLRAGCAVPVRSGDTVLGALLVAYRRPQPVAAEQARLLGTIANQLGQAMENWRLYRQVQQIAVLEERERLSREMHDGFGQLLTFLGLQLGNVRRRLGAAAGPVSGDLEEMRRAIADAYAELRLAIFDLRTAPGAGDFTSHLEHYLNEFRRRSGLAVELHLADGAPRHLPPAVELQVIRIIQEALTNVRRHAAAGRAVVRIGGPPEIIEVDIADPGRGFDPEAVRRAGGGYGLSGMTERARGIGGELSIESAPGVGTTVRLRLPLRAAAPLVSTGGAAG